jgi:hypothetical protein
MIWKFKMCIKLCFIVTDSLFLEKPDYLTMIGAITLRSC